MTRVDVKVLLNRQEEDGRLAIFSRFGYESKYREGDDLEHVATLAVDGESASEILNKSYAMTNRGSGSFVGDLYEARSVSAGDVFEVLGLRFAVESVGFRLVNGEGVWW